MVSHDDSSVKRSRRTRRSAARHPETTAAPDIKALMRDGKTMLDGRLPFGYGQIENQSDVLEELDPPADPRIARVTIVWDNPITNFPLEEVLERMRETGAAMVTEVREVHK